MRQGRVAGKNQAGRKKAQAKCRNEKHPFQGINRFKRCGICRNRHDDDGGERHANVCRHPDRAKTMVNLDMRACAGLGLVSRSAMEFSSKKPGPIWGG